jgi:hypothetical protein
VRVHRFRNRVGRCRFFAVRHMLGRCLSRQDDRVNPGVCRLACLAYCPTTRTHACRVTELRKERGPHHVYGRLHDAPVLPLALGRRSQYRITPSCCKFKGHSTDRVRGNVFAQSSLSFRAQTFLSSSSRVPSFFPAL